jgi:predicted PurR-regulated permease PerM
MSLASLEPREGAAPPRPAVPRDGSPPLNRSIQRFLTFITIILVVVVLQLAENVLIPIALAALLAFLLTPLVVRLQRWRMPRVPAVILTVLFAFAVLGTVGWIVTSQLIDLAQKLPDYERNIYAKVESLQETNRPDSFGRILDMIENLRADMEDDEKAAREREAARVGRADEPAPVPVEVRPTPTSSFQTFRQLVGPLLGPMATAGIAFVLFVAMLLQREDLRDRFIKVVSAGRINVATQAVNDAARRVSRYLLMQLIVNATYGLPVGIALYFIGIPNALLWGLLCTVLRFIPFLGPWIAAMFPIALAAAVAPGWEPLLYTILLFVVMELVSNNIIEIWLYGAGTGISNLALLVAAVFWTWVWGPIGLFLSTPMTVCILVMGKYIPGLRFLSMLLGSEPVLEPPAQFYQRMLAMDAEAMLDRAVGYARKRSLAEFYDGVYIPALILAEEDRHRGTLAEVRQKFIFSAGKELIDDLDRATKEKEDAEEEDAATEPETAASEPPAQPAARIFILSARDDADELVAYMLQHLLREKGMHAEVAPVSASIADSVARVCAEDFDYVVISALPPSAVTPARRMARYIREQCGGIRLLVGIWSEESHVSDLRMRLRQAKPDAVASRVGEAVALLQRLVSPGEPANGGPSNGEAAAATDSTAEEPIEELNLQAVELESRFDVLSRDLAQAFDVPISLVTIVDFDRNYWESRRGLPPDLMQHPAEGEHEATVPTPTLSGEDFKVVEDAKKERPGSLPPFLIERGVRFYACVALRRPSGQAVGTLCVIDTKPRQITPREGALLRQRAMEFMAAIESEPLPT